MNLTTFTVEATVFDGLVERTVSGTYVKGKIIYSIYILCTTNTVPYFFDTMGYTLLNMQTGDTIGYT